jgi:predicted nucleic acid-binding protein
MSRVFWDSMLFIYLLEGNAEFSARVRELLARSKKRGDRLFTSHLALGEVMAGAGRAPGLPSGQMVRDTLQEMGFTCLPFDGGAVGPFARLRSGERLKVADAIHLASAASAGIDLFLTGDRQISRLDVPGIQFIADFNNPVL